MCKMCDFLTSEQPQHCVFHCSFRKCDCKSLWWRTTPCFYWTGVWRNRYSVWITWFLMEFTVDIGCINWTDKLPSVAISHNWFCNVKHVILFTHTKSNKQNKNYITFMDGRGRRVARASGTLRIKMDEQKSKSKWTHSSFIPPYLSAQGK